mgnify:CR=1 FL=1
MAHADTLILAAVTLVATGKAKTTTQAARMAQELVLDLERLLARAPAPAKKVAPIKAPAAKPAPAKAPVKKAAPAKAPAKKAPAKKAAPGDARILGPRGRKALEGLGVVRPEDGALLLPAHVRGKLCAAHLDGAKACGPATIKQIAAWFAAHGEMLPAECATFDANWLTNRCDDRPEE